MSVSAEAVDLKFPDFFSLNIGGARTMREHKGTVVCVTVEQELAPADGSVF